MHSRRATTPHKHLFLFLFDNPLITNTFYSSQINTLLLLSFKDFQVGQDLSLAFRNFHCIPNGIAKSRRAYTIKKVDLTETMITDMSNLKYFSKIETLVLDKNDLTSIGSCPVLHKVHTLWCNNNKVSDLDRFLTEIAQRFPNLQYLSLMRNPVSIFDNETDEYGQQTHASEAQMKYRLGVLSKLPALCMLDSVAVTTEEVSTAKKVGSQYLTTSVDHAEGLGGDDDDSLDEDDIWKYPEGFSPPGTVRTDANKKLMMRRTQKLLEEQVIRLPKNKSTEMNKNWTPLDTLKDEDAVEFNCWDLAKESNFELNKRTVWRYHESSLWAPLCKKRPHYEAILETMRWRYMTGFPINDMELLKSELATSKMFHMGYSLDGKPLLFLFLSRENTWNPKANMQTLLYTMERCIKMMPPDKNELICLIDAKDLGMMNAPALQFIVETIDVLNKHYPRRMGQLFVINVSSIVFWFWDLVSMSLSEVTRKKIQFLTDSKEEMKVRIGEFIGMDQLLPEFGGSRDESECFDLDDYLSWGSEDMVYSVMGTEVVDGEASVHPGSNDHFENVTTEFDDNR